jgi:hypothetical protein
MRKLMMLLVGVLFLASAHLALADGVRLRLSMGFPAILPPLVVIQPGVSVVQDFDEEVFFTGGYYWAQRDGNWYRARDHRGTWSYVRQGRVPVALVQHEPGRYRRWQHDDRRAWPDGQHTARNARHWRPADREERQGPQEDNRRNEHDRH